MDLPPASDRSGRDAERPPSWHGAPGYTPVPELPAHAPMPGAPPYPERAEPGAAPTPAARTPTLVTPALLAPAAAVGWLVLDGVLVTLASGPADLMRVAVAMALSAVLTAVIGWALTRRTGVGRWGRSWPVVLALAPVYWVLRAVLTALLG